MTDNKPPTLRQTALIALRPHLQDIKAGHDEKIIDAILTAFEKALPEEKDAYRDGSNLTYEIFGYNSAINDMKAILHKEIKR